MKNKKPAKPAAAKKPATAKKPAAKPAAVKSPAIFEGADGVSITITPERITYKCGLREMIFAPRSARLHARPLEKSRNGTPLNIKAGSVSLVCGGRGVVFAPEEKEIIAAILAAKEAAKKGGAK